MNEFGLSGINVTEETSLTGSQTNISMSNLIIVFRIYCKQKFVRSVLRIFVSSIIVHVYYVCCYICYNKRVCIAYPEMRVLEPVTSILAESNDSVLVICDGNSSVLIGHGVYTTLTNFNECK